MPGNSDAIRQALQCANPHCACHRPRGRLHCPAHDDAKPAFSVREKDGVVLVHCFAGCTQGAVIEALRTRGLWEGTPSPTVRAEQSRDLLLEIVHFLEQYVVFPTEFAGVTTALWIAHAWVVDGFDVTPYLAVSSPEKRAGKSRLLELLELLTPRPWRIVQPSEGALYRKIAQDLPTLLLDEADAVWRGRSEDLEPVRAVLNAGYRRGATVPRCINKGDALAEFAVFCAKALAYIGIAPETIADRSIIIRMQRATPSEQRKVRRLRFREAKAEAQPLREALKEWAARALPMVREARPEIPEELDGRAADSWEPLLAVAEAAGHGWAVLAWSAAIAMSTGEAREDDSLKVRLLADIYTLFEVKEVDRLSSAYLAQGLAEDATSPWADWKGGRITQRAMASLLRPFGIQPDVIRTGAMTARGYLREQFQDAWERYVSPPEGFLSVTSVTTQSHQGDSRDFGSVTEGLVTDAKNGQNPPSSTGVTDVTDKSAPGGETDNELAFVREWNRMVLRRDLPPAMEEPQ